MTSSPAKPCAACAAPASTPERRLRRGGRIVRCTRCGHLELRDFTVRPDADEFGDVDRGAYRRAMSPERRSSASAIVLEVADSAGLQSYGIDPSLSAVEDARRRGLRVRHGHFPDEDWDRRDWGVITYMDVLEHIVDLDSIMRETVARVRRGGFLAVQVPVSTGIVYRTAALLDRASGGRMDGPFRRMLQTEFPYPHVHYFRRSSLEALFARFGLRTVRVSRGPIATGNFAARVAFRDRIRFPDRVQAAGLRVLAAAGHAGGRDDLLRLIARREA